MQYFYSISIFIFGAILGSFFNVVIYRLPTGESIVYGSSHCPKCQTSIKAYDLIPILSYFILGGRCRHCGAPISWRYPFIEALSGTLFLWTYLVYGQNLFTVIGLILVSVLIIIAMIDIDTMEIFDRFQIVILVLACVTAAYSGRPLLDHIFGFFVISVPFYLIAHFFEGLGGGDIKLVAVSGLLLGYQSMLVAFFIASMSGGLVGAYLLLSRKKERRSMIAFGPFLCLGIFLAYLYGPAIFTWYLNFFK